jgi:hypothetical protein
LVAPHPRKTRWLDVVLATRQHQLAPSTISRLRGRRHERAPTWNDERVPQHESGVSDEQPRVLAVLVIYGDGSKEFVDNSHVHGVRNGHVLLATGAPGAGLDAQIVRELDLANVVFVETVSKQDEDEEQAEGPDWFMGSREAGETPAT